MGFKLKPGQEAFTIVDGPLAGTNYKRGVEYPKAPEGYEDRFEDCSKKKNESKPASSRERGRPARKEMDMQAGRLRSQENNEHELASVTTEKRPEPSKKDTES